MDHIGKYDKLPFSRIREVYADALSLGSKRNHAKSLIELDVTKARELIRNHYCKTGEKISFTAWIIKCIGQAVSEHRLMHAMVKHRKIIAFHDVDVAVLIKSKIGDHELPLPIIIRKANTKSVMEIMSEITKGKKESLSSKGIMLNNMHISKIAEIFFRLPRFIRRLILKWLFQNPFYLKRTIGTVMLSSVGALGRFGFPYPIGVQPLFIALGDIVKKPGVIDDKINIREYLYVTIAFDHNVVDGAPATRFVTRFADLLENAYGII
ncbi:MAG: 2-oxo acid dehydrogenase subunit E2 [Candidatus Poribacteria bacterium]